MTLLEIQAWIKSAKHVDTVNDYYDDCGNRETTKIYEKNGQFFKIEFMNGHPYEAWNATKTGFVRGVYGPPTPVRKASRLEYVCEWVE
jgi:hypothetical protein